MKNQLLPFAIALSCSILFPFCDEPAGETLPPIKQSPPVVTFPNVQLAVGNSYHWRYVQIPNGGVLPTQWDVRSEITGDTSIDGDRYFVFSTGEVLRSTGSTVFTFSHNSSSEYLRLNVSVGESVPFMGQQFTVSSVDTSTMLGDTQRIITVSAPSGNANTLRSGRYASRFGLVEMDLSDATSVTWATLVGAHIGSVNYGYNP